MVKMHEQKKAADLKSLPAYHTGYSLRLLPWAGPPPPEGLNFVIEGESDERCVLASKKRQSTPTSLTTCRRRGQGLSNLIRRSIDIDKQIADAEQFERLKFKKRKINEEDIPMLMEEMGMDSVTVDGNKVMPAVRHARPQRTNARKRSPSAFHWRG